MGGASGAINRALTLYPRLACSKGSVMKNRLPPPPGGFSEHNERAAHHTPHTGHVGIDRLALPLSEEQLLLDYLLETGFAWEEAEKLLSLRDHLYDNIEMRQRMAD